MQARLGGAGQRGTGWGELGGVKQGMAGQGKAEGTAVAWYPAATNIHLRCTEHRKLLFLDIFPPGMNKWKWFVIRTDERLNRLKKPWPHFVLGCYPMDRRLVLCSWTCLAGQKFYRNK